MKTIYYAFVKTIEVPDNATEAEMDDIVASQVFEENNEKPTDYIWSEQPNLF